MKIRSGVPNGSEDELLKLDLKCCQANCSTVYESVSHPPYDRVKLGEPSSRPMWAIFGPVTSCRSSTCVIQRLFIFFIIELQSRRVVHFNVTRHPNDFWVARQLQAATADAKKPKFIIRDNDQKFGDAFDAMAKQLGIEVIPTPIRTPTQMRFVNVTSAVCAGNA